ncbi:MAG: 3'-phosphoesterase [Candidatus Omnitrophica bacterium]|nr:3'-phosphoesterase [Candidatus Omnitrophota bacterium]
MAHPPRFVVHEHHASRLHYDFRLEIDGVLKSWAVPKGPSMNPAEKRLAVMVDDHPLDYGSFEGVIPEGRYGAGAVVMWDAGTFEPLEGTDAPAGLMQGSLKFSLKGKRLKGVFALVKLKGPRATGKEWLLMKKADQDANPQFVLESALTPAKRRQLRETTPPCDAS